ncbi:MAG TPA: single-stranded DNA-binding protein [Phnomibacter sp.]|nr:single-stranded DNA-binding protein [Phnomibacter sp.]
MKTITNQVQLIGNLGTDPEIRETANNGKTARMRLATNEDYRSAAGAIVKRTHWHNLRATGRQAELAETLLKKGYEVAVAGKLVHTHYTDKAGLKRHFTVIEIAEIQIMGNRA